MTNEYRALNYTQRIIQGDSFNKSYALDTLDTDTEVKTPIDLSGKVAAGQIRLVAGQEPVIDFDASIVAGTGGVENTIVLKLTSQQTTTMRPGTWQYDVQLADIADPDIVTTVLKGTFVVRAEITE